jgi:hypothetical protein
MQGVDETCINRVGHLFRARSYAVSVHDKLLGVDVESLGVRQSAKKRSNKWPPRCALSALWGRWQGGRDEVGGCKDTWRTGWRFERRINRAVCARHDSQRSETSDAGCGFDGVLEERKSWLLGGNQWPGGDGQRPRKSLPVPGSRIKKLETCF